MGNKLEIRDFNKKVKRVYNTFKYAQEAASVKQLRMTFPYTPEIMRRRENLFLFENLMGERAMDAYTLTFCFI